MWNSRLDLHGGPNDGDVDVTPWRVGASVALSFIVFICLARSLADTKGPARRPDDDGSICGWW
jgi:hypothetical protein